MNDKDLQEELKNSGKNIIEKPDMVETSTLEDITDKVELKAFLENDEIMGKHIVLYVNRGGEENAVGLSVHPVVSKKLLQQLKDDGIL